RGRGQLVAVVGEPGVGKSRLYHEFIHSHHTHGWLILESGSVSYGKAAAYLPLADLLRAYFKIESRDDVRAIRAKVTGNLLTLAGGGSKTYYRQLRIDALPAESAEELLASLLGADASVLPLKPLLIARTEGNPLFLEESVRTLVEVGALAGSGGAYRLIRPLDT